jgi:hypothetical protein
MSEPTQPATTMIDTSCPRCHRPMSLTLTDGLDRQDFERLAKLLLCNSCAPEWHGARPTGQMRHSTPHAAPRSASYRAPYADD